MDIKASDLILEIFKSPKVQKLDMDKYDSFLDYLCGHREFQKNAIRLAISYILGGNYTNTRELAHENFKKNDRIREHYSAIETMISRLEFPEKLSCTIDLATGTGKSWIMYGIAQIMFCEGAIEKVLVLCPSLTIKHELQKKFRKLACDNNLNATLNDQRIKHKIVPRIIDASRTIKDGDICIDNIHKAYAHVSSSIEDSLVGNGNRTLILNDECHHLMNPTAEASKTDSSAMKEWKKFLNAGKYNFRYIVGLSGTPYQSNEYAADVIYRYTIMQAMEGDKADRFTIKKIDYVQKDEAIAESDRFEIIYSNHLHNKKQWSAAEKHITIFITRNISSAEKLAQRFIQFLVDIKKMDPAKSIKSTLVVTSSPKHEKNRIILNTVDSKRNPVEWIFSVSMLTEGWDVKNVFQIVPHEERAFNSRLLISQVLGRGLRVPQEYISVQPSVIIYNHDKWSSAIKNLVYDVMAFEKRARSYIVDKTIDYNLELLNISYVKVQKSVKKTPRSGTYQMPKIPELESQSKTIKKRTVYVSVDDGAEESRITEIPVKMYSVDRVVNDIYNKLKLYDEVSGSDYSKQLDRKQLIKDILKALDKIGERSGKISEDNKARVERSFDVLQRTATGTTVIKRKSTKPIKLHTKDLPQSSVSTYAFQKDASMIYCAKSVSLSSEDDVKMINEARENAIVRNVFETEDSNFKCPLNFVILSHNNEREFGRYLIDKQYSKYIDSWIKSVDSGFYEIPYSFRKGTHQKEANFNPDFFIKIKKDIIVIEIKSDSDASTINKAKLRYARTHFEDINRIQQKQKYHFKFLSPKDYTKFFETIGDGTFDSYIGSLEASLSS